ncbi:hypothetical protein Moror_1098 [Moniliophthora roreri MCA 2997]|uniref:Uncharacterized protein n=1 Tax=Moniliophthora roreri (strain MCA 2997) TaxID=1381753 RepID=V2XHI2_MONRO|nr:hypothetical protein Moror_1098 [Moniliophthora roreri MCA 2997]
MPALSLKMLHLPDSGGIDSTNGISEMYYLQWVDTLRSDKEAMGASACEGDMEVAACTPSGHYRHLLDVGI